VPKLRPVTLGRGLGIEEILHPHRAEILATAHRHGVVRLWVFGSVRRREATSGSDVDLLVRWSRPHSLLDRVDLAEDIERLVGRPVEIANEGGLHWAIEPQVESEMVPL
jgi:predicted nucleotidyltransferase